jgi:hypothetical protein
MVIPARVIRLTLRNKLDVIAILTILTANVISNFQAFQFILTDLDDLIIISQIKSGLFLAL